ncbi:Type 1 glutamine amidotransferase-like domain-containing protein, partial [Anaeromassilibacillus sp. SJQ-1]|uniref:Type 1 glutamine amidotransferase-like domain-containing protein n=1 Tax=Anaeromassilibacillus sp. SJQ-1 TaxID=3375419 RepID=UPI003989AD4A
MQREVNRGKLYIGESAGAIVTAPDIGYSAAMDDREKAPKLKEDSGLHLIDFSSFHMREIPRFRRPWKKFCEITHPLSGFKSDKRPSGALCCGRPYRNSGIKKTAQSQSAVGRKDGPAFTFFGKWLPPPHFYQQF